MKKIVISLITVVCLLATLAIPVLADRYTTYDADLSAPYTDDYFDKLLTARYNPASGSLYVRASTDVSIVNDEIGVSRVILTANNNEVVAASTPFSGTRGSECGNTLNSGKATVIGQSQASEVLHTGWRSFGINSDLTKYEVLCE